MQVTYTIKFYHVRVDILLENSDTFQKVLFEVGLHNDKHFLD